MEVHRNCHQIDNKASFGRKFWLAALVFGVVCIVVAASFQAMTMQVHTLENNLEKSTSKISELEMTTSTLTRQKKEAENKIQETNMRTETEIRNLRSSLTKVTREKDDMIKESKQQIHTLKNNLEKSTSKISELERTTSSLTRQKKEAENKIQESNMRTEIEIQNLRSSLTKVTREKDDMIKESKQLRKIKSLDAAVENYEMTVKKHEHTLDGLGLSPDCTYHPLKTKIVDRSSILQCLHLKYDTEKVNLKKSHINDAGELVNKPDTRAGGDNSGRFQNYWGTTSTAPLPLTDSPQYIEVLTNVEINRPLEERELVLETGICREGDRDEHYQTLARQYFYSLNVVHCLQHNSVCTRVWKDGHLVHYLCDTLPNTAGSHTTLHHGVVFDPAGNRIVFLDVKQMEVIRALENVDYTQPMWPMFGVYGRSKDMISMKLVVGNDIDMTPEKKAMIVKALYK